MSGCGQLVSNAKQEFAEDLSATMLEQNDPETVKQAVPAYLILVSSMIKGDPDNVELLISGSKLYGAYASVFVEERERKMRLSALSLDYAEHAFCIYKPAACNFRELSYYEFEQVLKQFNKEDVPVLFALGSAWAGWLQANSADWNAVAELPRIKAIIQRVLELDPLINNGDAYLYMAVMDSFLPPAMGGKPELAKKNFEQAIKVSDGENLMAKLLYAEKYARLVFDQALHDRLLKEVIDAKLENNESTLINSIAQYKARILLDQSNEYF
ncbi:MAG: TRAP transporter TatT component family protein [Gammaproteobacteria bacterium]